MKLLKLSLVPAMLLFVSVALHGEKAGDFPLTIDELRELDATAKAGTVEDKLLAGEAHELNMAENADAQQAFLWYGEASEMGSGEADVLMGRLYERGLGVDHSYEAAADCYRRAVERGLAKGNFWLGLMYLEGWGVEEDRERMAELVTSAAEAGFIPAMKVLSGAYLSGIGVEKDLEKALEWAKRAAETDKTDASVDYVVGRAYQEKVRQQRDRMDMLAAREWYALSAEQDYTRAMVAMAGTFSRKDEFGNIDLAREWLTLAVEGGNAHAAYTLARLELNHAGADASDEVLGRVRSLLEKGAELGSRRAQDVLLQESMGKSLKEAFAFVGKARSAERFKDRYNVMIDEKYTPDNRPPKLLRTVEAVYPRALKITRQNMRTRLRFTVGVDGRPCDIKVLSTTHPAHAKAAMDAVAEWRYEPAVKNGKKVRRRVGVWANSEYPE